jgi:hypothetical protein
MEEAIYDGWHCAAGLLLLLGKVMDRSEIDAGKDTAEKRQCHALVFIHARRQNY